MSLQPSSSGVSSELPGFPGRSAPQMPAAAHLVMRLITNLKIGSLEVRLPDGQTQRFGQGEPSAQIALSNWNVCGAALKSGDIGFAETYIANDWHTDDLIALMNVMVRNRTLIEGVVYGSWWGRLLHRVRHLRNGNTRTGSRRNIHAHYDLGNAFYRLWLDPSMTYSSALYGPPEARRSLHEAQQAKYQRLLGELQVDAGARILEIGCGWGGFAETAARAGATVTGLTLSTEQLAYAQQRMQDAGLAQLADLRLQDYRDSTGQFDAIASIEMFEAVGESYWPSYFACLKRSLKAGGRACIQSITIDDTLFARYRKSTDFIQQYVFPGGMLPSPSVFREHAERAGLRVVKQFAFGQDYARTLREWREMFRARLPEVRAQGFDERFVRTWDFYLCYCEAAFANANTDVIQFTLEHA
jgi:cyclopropane-fatty-acyl-phospholipid synthase